MKGTAPYSPETGSQALVTKKCKPKACQAIAERCNNSMTISPTIARTDRAANSISPRKPLSRLNTERCQAGALRVLVTSEISGVSDVSIFVSGGSKPLAVPGPENCLSGSAPIPFLPRTACTPSLCRPECQISRYQQRVKG